MAQRKSTASKLFISENLSPEDVNQEAASFPQVSLTHKKTAGEKLKAFRLEKGIKLDKISDILRISKRYLIAIEKLDATALPEQVYTLGFVRSYARYLEQDSQPFVDQFKQELYEGAGINHNLEMLEPVRHSELPTRKVLFLTLAALVVIGIGLQLYSPYRASSGISELVAAESIKPEPVKNPIINSVPPLIEAPLIAQDQNLIISERMEASPPVSASEAMPVSAEDPTVTFAFQDRTWLELKDKNHKIIISKNFEPQETYQIKAEEGITFETGNAGGFTIKQQGQSYKVGALGQVVKGKPLNPGVFIKVNE